MAKHVIDMDQTMTVNVTEGNSKWVLEKGVVLSGMPGISNETWDNVRFSIAGKIDGIGGVYSSSAAADSTDFVKVEISSTGRVESDYYGVVVKGKEAVINNDGRVVSALGALVVQGDNAQIQNSGKLVAQGATAVMLTEVDNFSFQNDGVISGNPLAASIQMTSGSGELVNGKRGLIEGQIWMEDEMGDTNIINRGRIEDYNLNDHASIRFGDGNDHLVNRGTIEGGILLQGGDDTADLRGGRIVHPVIKGGLGDDTFIISNKNITIAEVDGEGYDTIKTTVSFTMNDADDNDIEVIQAIGKNDVSLTGNDETNFLNGNAANNKLAGGGGIDVLWGMGGNDVLTGGDETDLFYFGTDSGVDTITDFTIDLDELRLIKINGIDDFADMAGRMTDADFNNDGVTDTIIDLGDGNRIRLASIDKGTLDADDFYIAPVI